MEYGLKMKIFGLQWKCLARKIHFYKISIKLCIIFFENEAVRIILKNVLKWLLKLMFTDKKPFFSNILCLVRIYFCQTTLSKMFV